MVSIVSDEFLKNERTEEKSEENHPFSADADASVPTLFQEKFNNLRKRATNEADELKISLTDLCGDDDKLKNEWELR